MTNRILIYPLLLLGALLLLTLWRQGPRWHAGPIAQLGLVLVAAVAALVFQDMTLWVVLGWMLLAGFVVVPRLWTLLAWRRLMTRDFTGAAQAWRRAAHLVWGRPGQVLERYALALQCWAQSDRAGANNLIGQLLSQPLPIAAAGHIHVWQLSLLVASREWSAAVAYYETTGDWGLLATATQARLLVARAYAELGRLDRALRCLQFVALSPRTVGDLARQLWSARVSVAALAGDGPETERLLGEHAAKRRRGFERFAAIWRGRCALVRGQMAEAQRQLTRALALTPPRAFCWRAAIEQYRQAADNAANPLLPAAETTEYQHGQAMLRAAVATAAPWRALLEVEPPGRATRALLAAMSLVWLATVISAKCWPETSLVALFGNAQQELLAGAWWRPVTALFLHTEWWHLAMNGVGLWVFGGAVERALGWGRLLTLFILAGALGNLWSVLQADDSISIGASGGVFALLGAFGVLLYRLDVPLYARHRKQLLFMLTLMVGVDLSIGALETLVDNQAHLGGCLAGIALAWLLTSGQKRGQPRPPHL